MRPPKPPSWRAKAQVQERPKFQGIVERYPNHHVVEKILLGTRAMTARRSAFKVLKKGQTMAMMEQKHDDFNQHIIINFSNLFEGKKGTFSFLAVV